MSKFGNGWWLKGRFSPAITQAGAGGGGVVPFDPVSLFSGGRKGVFYDFTNKANLFTDASRTTPVVNATDLIGSVTDLSGNNYHAAQAGSIRPAWNNGRGEFASGDFMTATGVDFSATGVVTAIVACYKANDTYATALLEHGLGVGANQPGFRMTGPPYNGGGGFGCVSYGTAVASAQNAPNSPAPIYAVVTIIANRNNDTCLVRVNGVISYVATADQGDGLFQLADLYVGAGSGGTNLYFGCNQYKALAIDYELTEDALNNAEANFAAALPGVTIGPAKFTLVAMGDSYTYGVSGGVTANQAYVKQLDTRLSRVVWSENLGISGQTTSAMMGRRREMLRTGIPNMAIIYGGQNDSATTTVQASPTPTSTVFTVGYGGNYGEGSWITVGGVQAQVLSVATNTITLTAPLAGGAPSAGTVVASDTEKNLTELALYVKNAGCKRVMILGKHYSNLASGADTVSVEQPANAAMRVKQRAAATAAGVVYVDLYAHGCSRINGGLNAQGDALWHVSSYDDHLSLAGQTNLIADAIEEVIVAQGWT